ncbi:MAG: hypothetical protein H9864_08520 [Candidatus Faecalibacterium intestinavium]|uniref:FMN-binding protein n=1 Tax=Candidatus Faecalibacterium intestinavium TaxID=2838580 RepID=A0A9E2KM39_9FIRM|nr:hypothetical protein [Candidatus Faecalibacterium intestinavium]
MKKTNRYTISCILAAAMLLTACGKSGSGSSSSSGTTTPGSGSAQNQQSEAWRTGLNVQTRAESDDRTGEVNTIFAAVLLDEDGRIARVTLDELESSISADGSGSVTMPGEYRTKRQKGDEYPLAAVSSIQKGWSEQVDFFGEYLTGMTAEQVSRLETDKDGYASEPDLLSGCTIKIEGYRDAVAAACKRAEAIGSAEGDTLSLGVEATSPAGGTLKATDDKDASAEIDITAVVVTLDAAGRVTGALWDEAEPVLTVAADGMVDAPDEVLSKLEMGDDYGMRKASALGKEWYEHSEGFCDYLKGKTAEEIEAIPSDGSLADLESLCTISISDAQKALLKALDMPRAS